MRDVARVLMVAAAYWVAGRLALLMAIPPGYATAVWPAAGLALVAVLAWGNRVAPGVAIGSIAVNLATTLHGGSAAAIAGSIAITGVLGAGAALEAIAGAALIRRTVGYPTSLDDGRDIVRFAVLGGPIACLTSATIGVTTLCSAGIMSWADYGYSWFTWWVGDTIGVLIFAPISILWIDRRPGVDRRRRGPIAALLLLGFVGVTALFVKVSAWEARERRIEFDRHAAPIGAAIDTRLTAFRDSVVSLAELFTARADLDRAGFRVYALGVMQENPGLEALGWDPVVSDGERADLEAAARRDGLADFAVTEQDASGALVAAGHRASYVPVYYLEPEDTNRRALGFDVASEPVRAASLAEASRTGQPAATPRIGLVQDRRDDGVLLFAPASRDSTLRGYAVGVLHLERLLAATLADLDTAGLDVHLRIDGDPPDAGEPGELARRDALDFGGRDLQLDTIATSSYLAHHRSWQAWLVLAGGMLFVGLLEIVLLQSTGQATLMVRAEQRFRLAIEAAPTGMIVTDPQGRIVLANVHAERLFGYHDGELIGRSIDLLVPQPQRAGHASLRNGYLADPRPRRMGTRADLSGVHKDGHQVPVEIGLTPIEGAQAGFVLSSIVDITDRQRAEREREQLLAELRELNTALEARVDARTRELTATLAERDVLLKEVHHRVKNNLQVISSLISLQLRTLDEPRSRAALEDCRGRVLAMALIHEKLYLSSDYARVPFPDYVRSLALNLFMATGTSRETVTLELAIDDVVLAVDKAIPCGLVLNELVSNALKHAFPGGRGGTLRVTLHATEDGQLCLTVADDGAGMPAALDVAHSPSLGLRIVHTLAEQLSARIEVTRDGGTRFALTFAP